MEFPFDRSDGWYYASDLGEGIWRISDCGSDNIYLVIGDDRGLVFDTGHGAGDLPGFLGGLTGKPLAVAMSHCHGDHAGGNDFFDTVYGGLGDIEGLHRDGIEEKREAVRNSRRFPDGYVLPRETPVPKGSGRMPSDLHGCPGRRETIPVGDGYALDLGNRVVRFLTTPGHTPGSLCLLDERTGTLFTGDTYVPHEYWGPMWLHISHSTKLSVYLDSLRKMAASGAVRMLSGHGEHGFIDAAALTPYIVLIGDIIAGRKRGEPLETFIGEGLFIGCGDSSIVYSEDKL